MLNQQALFDENKMLKGQNWEIRQELERISSEPQIEGYSHEEMFKLNNEIDILSE